jgi:hypothetical protein
MLSQKAQEMRDRLTEYAVNLELYGHTIGEIAASTYGVESGPRKIELSPDDYEAFIEVAKENLSSPYAKPRYFGEKKDLEIKNPHFMGIPVIKRS